MLAHKDAFFTFARHPGVEPTTDHAERALRALIGSPRAVAASDPVNGYLATG